MARRYIRQGKNKEKGCGNIETEGKCFKGNKRTRTPPGDTLSSITELRGHLGEEWSNAR